MLQGEHSAVLSTFTKLPFSIKTFVLSIFKWSLKTGLLYLEANSYTINPREQSDLGSNRNIVCNIGYQSSSGSVGGVLD